MNPEPDTDRAVAAGDPTSRLPSGPRWAAGLTALTAALLLVRAWSTWPDVAALRATHQTMTAFMARDTARGIAVRWEWVPAERISVHVFRAVLVAEDIEFFSHSGFSTTEIRAAVEEAFAGERVRGASTVTQQLAKNLWLDPTRSAARKLREALLTWQLERVLSKHRILELYVNLVQFGPGLYGVGAAARFYFGKPAGQLTELEAARLAAGLSRPSTWNPASSSTSYAERVALIRARMARARFLWRHLEGTVPTPPLRLDTVVPESLPGLYPPVPPPDSIDAESVLGPAPDHS